ncbi:MAG: M20 family metallopeptidase [Gemmatimonadota bacterium]|nr:M20 family metallopeptidase [Gemmatimonadota bacterium]
MAEIVTEEALAEEAVRTLEHVRGRRDEFVDFLSSLCRVESPTDHPETQSGVHAILGPAFEDLGYEVRVVEGRVSGNHLLAFPKRRDRSLSTQLLIGHSDTVWPLETIERMPVQVDEGRLHGPGTLDMKGGLTQIVFALRALRDLGHEPDVTPVVFVNSDEEVGSPDSKRHVRRLARAAVRALVLEPSLGPRGLIKTARKGLGRFDITVRGRAAHAGLEPEAGASAILELAHVIQRLNELNDPERGTTVNVGRIDGGTRPNVIAAEARASVDVRVTSLEFGAEVERRVHAIKPSTPGVTLQVEGGIRVAPLERTPRNMQLWETARAIGGRMGFDLEDAMAGGGSDGNTTSLFTATLDGLGCVGDGAHANHEHIVIEPSLDRCALLTGLLLAPDAGRTPG